MKEFYFLIESIFQNITLTNPKLFWFGNNQLKEHSTVSIIWKNNFQDNNMKLNHTFVGRHLLTKRTIYYLQHNYHILHHRTLKENKLLERQSDTTLDKIHLCMYQFLRISESKKKKKKWWLGKLKPCLKKKKKKTKRYSK